MPKQNHILKKTKHDGYKISTDPDKDSGKPKTILTLKFEVESMTQADEFINGNYKQYGTLTFEASQPELGMKTGEDS